MLCDAGLKKWKMSQTIQDSMNIPILYMKVIIYNDHDDDDDYGVSDDDKEWL